MTLQGTVSSLTVAIFQLFGSAFRITRGYLPDHDGIDLAAPIGTPIRAVASGKVTYARNSAGDNAAGSNWAIGGGNVVNIDIGGNKTTQYAHLASVNVLSGQTVRKGQVIGTVGQTGNATGPHLHFGLWDRSANKMVNPTAFLIAAASGWTNPGVTDQQLGGWGDLIRFPANHILTNADVDTIIQALKDADARGKGCVAEGRPCFFAGSDPLSRGVAESVMRDILRTFVGQPWNKATQDAMQAAFNKAAKEAADLGGYSGVVQGIAGLIGALMDPGNWVRILALLAGAGIFAYGSYGVLRSTGSVRV